MKILQFYFGITFLTITFLGLARCEPNLPNRTETSTAPDKTNPTEPIVTPQPTSFTPSEERFITQETTTGIQWFIHANVIPDWPTNSYYMTSSWDSSNLIRIDWDVLVSPNQSQHHRQLIQLLPNTDTPIQVLPPIDLFKDLDPSNIFYSPNGTYVLAHDNKKLILARSIDGQLIGQEVLDDSVQDILINWSEDGTAVAIVFENAGSENSLAAYVWKSTSPRPDLIATLRKIVPYGLPSFSPDKQKLAIPTSDMYSLNPEDQFSYIITYADGRPPKITHVGIGPTYRIQWLTNDILYPESFHGGDFYYYLVAETGVSLKGIGWIDRYKNSQMAMLSPNQRWFMIDQTDTYDTLGDEMIEFKYILYDFLSGHIENLLTSSENVMDFLGWSEDNAKFFLIRRPLDRTIQVPVSTPHGLMALNPITLEYHVLNPDVVYAWLCPKSNCFIGLSILNGSMVGTYYSTNGIALTSPIPVATNQLSNSPRGMPPLILTWSNNGSQVAYLDSSGSLWISRNDGTTTLLGNQLELEIIGKYMGYSRLQWSPDDQLMLVQAGSQAWVILPPLEPGTSLSFAAIQMDSSEIGSVRTISGHILKTSDGGLTWQEEITPSAGTEITWPEMDAPFFLSTSTGWRVVANELQKTTNGGAAWSRIKLVNWPHVQLDFTSDQIGWAIVRDGEESTFLRTSNGGTTWKEIKPVVAK